MGIETDYRRLYQVQEYSHLEVLGKDFGLIQLAPTMRWERFGKCSDTDVRFHLVFRRSQFEPNTIEIELEIDPIYEEESDNISVDVPKAAEISKNNGVYRIILDFERLSEGWVEILNDSPPNRESSIKIDVPHPNVFTITKTIVESGDIEHYTDWMEQYFQDEREGYYLINFRAAAEKILSYDDYLTVLSYVSRQHPRVRSVVYSNSVGYFKNRIINHSKPNPVTSLNDLIQKVERFNSTRSLPTTYIDAILGESLAEYYKRLMNSGYDYIKDEFELFLPSSEDEYEYLSRKNVAQYLACLLVGGETEQAQNLIVTWLGSSETATNSDSIISIENQISDHPSGDVRDLLGEYLYYVARSEDNNNRVLGTFALYHASSNILKESPLENEATFWARVKEAKSELGDRNDYARELFDEALAAINPIFDQHEKYENWKIDALYGKYQAIIAHHNEGSVSHSTIEYIEDLVERDLSELSEHSELRQQVEALRFELMGRENARNGAFELAGDNFDQALSIYSKTGLDKPRANLYAIHQELQALSDELDLKFESASEIYNQVSEIYSKSLANQQKSNQISNISNICLAKHHIMNSRYDEAQATLGDIDNPNSEIVNQVNELNELMTILSAEHETQLRGEISRGSVIKTKRVDGMLEVEFYLGKSRYVAYVSIFLRNYGFPSDLIDEMVELSLIDSLPPQPVDLDREFESSASQEHNLLFGVLMEDFWQSKLPTHIHYRIEKLKIDEVTQAENFTSLSNEITITLEIFLVIICEFYSKRIYGEVAEEISPLNKATLYDLIQFLNGLPVDAIPTSEDLQELFSREDDQRELHEIRNTGHHGGDIWISKPEYETIRDEIITIFRSLAPHCPIIIEVRDQNQFGFYLCLVHWGGIRKRAWLDTEKRLESNELYYVSPDVFGNNYLKSIPENSIFDCEAERAKNVSQASIR